MTATSVLRDTELRDEILERVSKGAQNKMFPPISQTDLAADISAIVADEGQVPSPAAEAIILPIGRPALMVRGGTFEVPESDTWKARLSAAQANIDRAIASVGRIEVKNHPGFEWIGTGWFVGDGIVVTNRHVANEFATRSAGGGFSFRRNFEGREIRSRIDLREEHFQPDEVEINVTDIIHIEPEDGPDMAFLAVDTTGGNVPPPLVLAQDVAPETDVAVIGYPAWDGRRNDPAVMKTVFNDIYNVKRLQPGRIMTADGNSVRHDCSTLGGNSGSPVVALSTGEAVGLHFSGLYGRYNSAVPASVVRARLNTL